MTCFAGLHQSQTMSDSHVLLFKVLYKLAHTESCKKVMAAECNRRFVKSAMTPEDGGGGMQNGVVKQGGGKRQGGR